MKKRIIALILILMFVFSSTIYASENILTLDDILSKVETSNTMKTLDYQLKGLDNYYERTKDIAELIPVGLMRSAERDLSQTVVGPPITVFILGEPVTYDHTLSEGEIRQILANFGFPYTKKDKLAQDTAVYTVPKAILSSYRVLEKTKELTLESLKLSTEELYYGLLMQNEAVKLQEEIAAVDNLKLKNMEQKYKEGFVSKKELENFKLSTEQTQLNLNIQKRTMQNMIYSLNKLIGTDIAKEYDGFGTEIIEREEYTADIEKAIESALQNRFEIFEAKEDIENKKRDLLFTNIYYKSDEPEYLNVKYKLRMAERELQELEEDIAFELEDAYQTIILNYNKIKKAKIELNNAQQKYEDMNQKYNNGLITKDILDLTHIGVTSANLNLLGAINSYNMSIKKFEAAMGIGPKFAEEVNR